LAAALTRRLMKPGPAISAVDQAVAGRVGQQRIDQPGGQFARVHFQLLGQLHGDVAGHVAVRRIAWSLQHDVGNHFGAGQDGARAAWNRAVISCFCWANMRLKIHQIVETAGALAPAKQR
jgi:hypothetical protein